MLVGIVGKPSCGKSTFFKASTLADVEIANYPFTTIKPNHAVGYVKVNCPDQFFNKQCNPREGFCVHHKRFIPVEMLDVAGLVPGASEGVGMGNQFLDDLRQADVLIHVIDVSGSVNEKGEPVEPLSYDPANDIMFLEKELDLWYNGILKKGWDKFSRQVQQEKSQIHKSLAKQLSGLKVTEDHIEGSIKKLGMDPEKPINWTDDELMALSTELRKLTKPILIAANKADVPGAKNNVERLQTQFSNYMIIPCSAESELALKEATKKGLLDYVPGESDFQITNDSGLSDRQKLALDFIKKNILQTYNSTGVQTVLDQAVFKLLGAVAIFPGGVNKLEDKDGNTLPDCFLMPKHTTALDFAFKLHTDFGKNFIRAINVKTKMPVAKDYKLENCDVVEIVSGK